jgi:hypothetical protein
LPVSPATPPTIGLNQDITYNTVITVTSSLDPNDRLNETCYNTYTSGQSAVSPCTLRRALVEANSPGIPRPVQIRFAVPLSDEGYLEAVDAWLFNIGAELPIIGRDGGQVTIDGTTQPDGRNDGPRIIVNGRTFQVGVGVINADENIIRGLAFQNADIQVGSDNNRIENNWLGLSADGQRPYQITDDPRSVGNAAIDVNNSNDNIIRENVVTSGNGIDIQGDNNTVAGNFVGTRADGTIPEIPANRFCQQGAVFDTWRGGGGIDVNGSNNTIGGTDPTDRNVLVSLLIQGASFNPAIAFFGGSGNTAQNNYIGRDANGNDVGTCSVGIRAEGANLQLIENVIVGTGAEAISVVTERFTTENITWRSNVIIDPADKNGVFFNQNVPDALKLFESAIITSIEGTTVEGTSAPGSDCPECIIEVFLDNDDDVIETLEPLALATAASDGSWTATIPAPLDANEGLRTSSTTDAFNVIENFPAGTSADFSADVYNEAGVISTTVRQEPPIEPRPPQDYPLFPEPRQVPDLPQINPTSVITVETTADLPGAISATCISNSDSPCTLRRALRQASEAPADQRPILVRFNLDTSDPGYDAETGTWLFEVTATGTDNTLEVEGGRVIIDGTTQPGGRTDGPPIVINGSPLTIGGTLPSSNYIVRGLLLLNNNLIINGSNTFLADNWFGLTPDGQNIYFPGDGNPNSSQRSGVRLTNRASNIVVRDNRFVGSGGIALDIESSDSIIANNYIGTRADGSVPAPPDEALRCNENPASGNWFGGGGVQLSGSRNQLTNNVIAGLSQIGADTTAITMNGAQHLLANNRIGVDATDTPSYICGFGIQVDGEFSQVLNNTLSGTASEAFFIGGTGNFGITLRGNEVSDVEEGYVRYGDQVPTALIAFNPAAITSIDGTTVEGTSGADSPCPYCTVEIFLDDEDDERETLESLAVTTADANGNWTATLARAIDTAAGERLRTMSTLNDLNIVAGFEAGTTNPAPSASLYPVVALTGLVIEGPTSGALGTTYTFTATIQPANAARPVEVVASFEDLGSVPVTISDETSNAAVYEATWGQSGIKELEFTATNEVSTITERREITIESSDTGSTSLYLPLIQR